MALTVIIYTIWVYNSKPINDLRFIAKAQKLKILTFQRVIIQQSTYDLLKALQLRIQLKLCRYLVRLVLFNQHKTRCKSLWQREATPCTVCSAPKMKLTLKIRRYFELKDGAAFFESGGHGHIGPSNKKVRGPSPPPGSDAYADIDIYSALARSKGSPLVGWVHFQLQYSASCGGW